MADSLARTLSYPICSVQFSLFSLFNSIKSITSPRCLLDIELVVVKCIQILMHKVSIHKVTIIIQAGNKMSLIYGYLIDWFNWYDWLIHFHNCIWYGPHHKNIHIILYCIYIASYGDNSLLYNIASCSFFFKEFSDFSHLFTAYNTDFS
jgi:hypothetical protein